MVVNIIIWLALVALAIFFGWLVKLAWRARSWLVRLPGVLVAGILTLLTVLILGVSAIGLYKLYFPTPKVVQASGPGQIQATQEMVQRGEHLAGVFCISCHSTTEEMPLTGGVDIARDIPMPIGSLISINLTPAGPLKDYTDEDIWRVLREGIGPDGRRRVIMGATFTRNLSDEDMKSLIAFLRSQPAVESDLPNAGDNLNFLGVLLIGGGVVPDLPPVTEEIVAPTKAATAEYGKYILSYQDCRACHGENLLGGQSALGPSGPGLRTVRGMTNEQFITMMRTGVRADGHQLQPPMPWKAIGRMDDVELSALYKYLLTIP